MRIGLIGAGRIGSIHAHTLAGLPAVKEVLVFDIEPTRARALADQIRGRTTDTVDAIFSDSDAVIIASTADTHAELLRRASEAAVPAFCEKPIAIDLAESRAAVEAVQKAGILVQIGFQRRFDAGFRRVRDMVRRGDLGTLYVVRHTSHDHDTPPADYVPLSGGIYRDNLIHDFDLVRFVTGVEVEMVYAAGSVLVADYFARSGDVDTSAVVLHLTGGTLGLMSAVRHDPVGYDVRIEVFGSKDTVAAGLGDRAPMALVGPATGGPAIARPDDPYRTWTARFGEAYRAELEAFVDAIRSGPGDVAATAEDALEALRIAVACGISRTEHRPVNVSEIEEGSARHIG